MPEANTYLPPSPVVPRFLVIISITNDYNAVVTVVTDNSYVVGQLVTFSVPNSYGMWQISGQTGQILSVDETNKIFTTSIDSQQYDTFSLPSLGQEQPATLTSGGSRNLYNITTVPFKSLDGTRGN